MQEDTTKNTGGPSKLSRRTLAAGAAWAVPAIAVAGAAPAYAMSGTKPSIVIGGACKLPGASCSNLFIKGYVFKATICNTDTKPIYLYNQAGYAISVTDNSPNVSLYFHAAVNATTGDPITFPYHMAASECVIIILNAGDNANSANLQNVTVTVTAPWGHTANPADDHDGHTPSTASAVVSATPPEQNPNCVARLPEDCG